MSEINVNLREGSFSINGSEEFIEKHMKDLFGFVEKNKDKAFASQTEKIEVPSEHSKDLQADSGKIDNTIQKYVDGGAIHIDSEGFVSILGKIPGNSKSEKMKNIAIIVSYVKKAPMVGKELKPLFEKHACLDASNFAATFKNEKRFFVKKGKGQNWTIELTQPGEEKAIELLEGMIA